MPPDKSCPLFALLPGFVAQNQKKMALGRPVHRLHHVILQDKDGLVLRQLLKDKIFTDD